MTPHNVYREPGAATNWTHIAHKPNLQFCDVGLHDVLRIAACDFNCEQRFVCIEFGVNMHTRKHKHTHMHFHTQASAHRMSSTSSIYNLALFTILVMDVGSANCDVCSEPTLSF